MALCCKYREGITASCATEFCADARQGMWKYVEQDPDHHSPFTCVCDAAEALIVPAKNSVISPTQVMGTGLFNLEKAQGSPGWLKVCVIKLTSSSQAAHQECLCGSLFQGCVLPSHVEPSCGLPHTQWHQVHRPHLSH